MTSEKLKYKTFCNYASLVEYVNSMKLEKEDIQSIIQIEYHNIILIYWG